MKNIFLCFLLLTLGLTAAAQQEKRVVIDVRGSRDARMIGDVVRLQQPTLVHENTTLTADSADFNEKLNVADAYGHVVITQSDGTVIYSDKLHYDGNTRVALLTGNVKMIDKEGAILTTNVLTYNTATKIARYVEGGKIVNKGDVLTSRNGYYFSGTQDAYFGHNVVITNVDALIKADTMRYNSRTRMTFLDGPTHIYGKEDTLYTELGTYNTETRQAYGFRHNVYQQGSKYLKGDSIFYDDMKGFGRARRNVVFMDTGPQKIMLYGHTGIYNRVDTSAMMTDHPYVIFVTQDSSSVDSIYMTADTLVSALVPRNKFKPVSMDRMIFDVDGEELDPDAALAPVGRKPVTRTKVVTPQKAPPKEKKLSRKERKKAEKDGKKAAENKDKPITIDSLAAPLINDSIPLPVKLRPKTAAQLADSVRRDSLRRDSIRFSLDTTKVRTVVGYHHVKIFKSDLQSRSDSAFYSYQDSVIRSYGKPMIWSQGSQMSADTIYLQMKNKKLDRMLMLRNGLIVSTEGDSTSFNQVKGKTLTGYFKENTLQRMFVDGNAESLYFVRDSLTKPTSANRTTGSILRINFKENQLESVTGLLKMTGKFIPIELLKEKELPGFIWEPKKRPASKDEIIPAKPKKNPAATRAKPGAKPLVTPKPAVKKPLVKPAAKSVAAPVKKAEAQTPVKKIE